MAYRFEDGRPQGRDGDIVMVAAAWEPPAEAGRARAEARDLADEGFHAVWLAGATADAAERGADAARRAGLAVVLDEPVPALAGQAHVLVAGDAPADSLARVDSLDAAWRAFFGGARIVCADPDDGFGLSQYLEVLDHAPAWRPRGADEEWLVAGADAEPPEEGAYSDEPQAYRVETPHAGYAIHWIDPATGELLGIAALTPDEPHAIQFDEEPIALYIGPNRFVPDETRTLP